MKTMLKLFLLTFLAFASLFLNACANDKSKKSKAITSDEVSAVQPAPTLVTIDPYAGEPLAESEFIKRLQYKRDINTIVVRGHVKSFLANERAVPKHVWPEKHKSLIVTKVALLTEEVVCGKSSKKVTSFSYVGGRIGKRWLRTSLMPQDLIPGHEYILNLSEIDGEYFLLGGRYESLIQHGRMSGLYTDSAGLKVSMKKILGECK